MYKKITIDSITNRIINIIIPIIYLTILFFYSVKVMERILSYEKDFRLAIGMFVILFLVTYSISCICHEIGHVLGAIKKGYTIRIFKCGILLIIKNNNDIKIKLKVTKSLFGGFVVINLSDKIKNDKDYENLYKDNGFISLCGIYSNILIIVIALIKNTIYKYDIVSSTFIIVNVVTIIAACSKNQDLWRAFSLDNREDLVNGILVEELLFQEENNQYIYMKVSEYINNYLIKKKYSINILCKLTYLIQYSAIFNVSLSNEIKNFLYWINEQNSKENKNIGIVEKVIITRLIQEMQDLNILKNNTRPNRGNMNSIHPNHKTYIEVNSYKENIKKLSEIKIKNCNNKLN